MNKKINAAKRQSLQKVVQASGATTLAIWATPIVMSVSLPAHAATTAIEDAPIEDAPIDNPSDDDSSGDDGLNLSSGLFSGTGTIPQTTVLPI